MWPFRKKPALPPPADVVVGSDRATFDSKIEQWEFEIAGVQFTLSGREFNPLAFHWARTALAEIRRLETQIDKRVLDQLEEWPCNQSARKLLCVSLDDYASEGLIDLTYIGDESWGDFGVNVIAANGEIVDAYGGD